MAWSHRDPRHVLTAHDDGRVRLWDLAAGGDGGVSCLARLDVVAADAALRVVTRVLFLSRYDGPDDRAPALTPPFLTGSDMNHTVTLWSPFGAPAGKGTVVLPRPLRVFGLRNADSTFGHVNLSSMLSLELVPAPYRPPLAGAPAPAPSGFVLLAERTPCTSTPPGGRTPRGPGPGRQRSAASTTSPP